MQKSQIKFTKSERTGELIGFVSRHSKTHQLKGVREDSRYGKQICVLSEDLKGTVEPNVLYESRQTSFIKIVIFYGTKKTGHLLSVPRIASVIFLIPFLVNMRLK